MANSLYDTRYVATVCIEATTPLKVGSSDLDMLQDAPVQKDWNDLPMIPGTSIAGVLRKHFDADFADAIFGDEQSRIADNKGSRLIVSNALLCDENMQVCESLMTGKSDFLRSFETLPIREHVRITEKGVADTDNAGKYDEEVVYRGSRFKFRLEMLGTQEDARHWQRIVDVLHSASFRLGGGTTKGFGDVKVLPEQSSYGVMPLDSDAYRKSIASLNTRYDRPLQGDASHSGYVRYTLEIVPEDFFMFGSGFGDDDADMTPVYESVADYESGTLSPKKILLPASSIKGALAHRSVYHYNRLNGHFIGDDNARTALPELFGEAKDDGGGEKGKVLIGDCFGAEANGAHEKVFDHVAIDRFTGGAIDGALFNEKTVSRRESYTIEILVDASVEKPYIEAFEAALEDVCNGMLPLGGATSKGHGVFTGRWRKS